MAIPPTPTVGAVGLLADAERALTMAWGEGEAILLLGPLVATLGGSEYLATISGTVAGAPPALDLDYEARLQRFLLHLHNNGAFWYAAHDTSEGGLAVALAEMAIVGGVGATIGQAALDALLAANDGRLDRALFSKAGSRIVVTCGQLNLANVRRFAEESGIEVLELGQTGGDALTLGEAVSAPVAALREAWDGGLAKARG